MSVNKASILPGLDATSGQSECDGVRVFDSYGHVTPHIYLISVIAKKAFEGNQWSQSCKYQQKHRVRSLAPQFRHYAGYQGSQLKFFSNILRFSHISLFHAE